MNSIFDVISEFFAVVIVCAILWFIWRTATGNLNAGLPKFGKGKKQKGGGDAVVGYTEKQIKTALMMAGKGVGRTARTIISAPFRRRP